tara:strand:- start:2455 stop:3654 length:1200 start_codon:yes stop_codon:yes gene_type:complete
MVDGFINSICFISIVQYYLSLKKDDVKSYLINITKVFLMVSAGLTLVRSAVFFLGDTILLNSLLDLLRVFLPLVIALFFEALIKRHYPKIYKWSLVLLTIFLLFGYLFSLEYWKDIYQLSLIIIVVLSAGFILIEKKYLNTADKQVLFTHLIAIILSIPFLAFEFYMYNEDTIINVSTASFSALVFINVLAQLINGHSRPYNVLTSILWYFIVSSLFVGIMFISSIVVEPERMIEMLFIMFTIQVAFGTSQILRSYEIKKNSATFISWLVDQKDGFVKSMNFGRSHGPGLGDFIILAKDELDQYDSEDLIRYGSKNNKLINHSALKSKINNHENNSKDSTAEEQLIDIMESQDMSDIFFLTIDPLRIMLINYSNLRSTQSLNDKIELLSYFASAHNRDK